MMRTAKTPGDRERGFQLIAPHAARFVKELIDGFVTELNDHTLRYRLLELIAKARPGGVRRAGHPVAQSR